MKCSACGHENPADSAFCEECGSRLVVFCSGCAAENRPGARFCRNCGGPLPEGRPSGQTQTLDVSRFANPSLATQPRQAATAGAAEASIPARPGPAEETGRRPVAPLRARFGVFPAAPSVLQGQQPGAATTHFVGREAELSELSQALTRASKGTATFVSMSGEPGTGKTRLLEEFSRSASGAESLLIRASERLSAFAMQVAADLIRRLLNLSSRPSAAELDASLGRLLPDESWRPFRPALATLLDLPEVADSLEPQVRRRLVLRCLQQLLTARAAEQTLLVTIDDAQWCDPSSLALIGQALSGLEKAAVLLLTSSRPPFEPPWQGRQDVKRLTLEGLTAESTRALAEQAAGGRLDPQTLEFLHERTQGNPLFIDALLQRLRRERHLESSDGALRLPLRRYLVVPESLEEFYRLQLENLGESIRLALGPAVVLDDDFSVEDLRDLISTERTWSVPESLVTNNLTLMLEHALVVELPQQRAYRFRHPRVREVAAALAPQLRLTRLHVHVARLLEQMQPAPDGATVERLAYHYGRGDRALKAIEYQLLAAERDMRFQAVEEALIHYRAAAERLQELPGAAERRATSADVLSRLADVEAQAGSLEDAERRLRAALADVDEPLARVAIWERLASVIAQQWRHRDCLVDMAAEEKQIEPAAATSPVAALALARLRHQRLILLRDLGWFADAVEAAEGALNALAADDPQFDERLTPAAQDTVARICTDLGEVESNRRQYERARTLFARARLIQERLGNQKQVGVILNQVAHLAWLQSDLDRSASDYQEARELQSRLGDVRGAALSTHNLALVSWRQWRLSDAETYLLEALAGLELAGELQAIPAALANLERIYWYRGDFERLAILHAKKLALGAEAGWNLAQAHALYRGRLAFEQGDLAVAIEQLERARSLVDTPSDDTAIEASVVLGQALLAAERIGDADAVLHDTLRLADERGLTASIGLIHLALAELECARGNLQEARLHTAAVAEIAERPEQRPRLATRHLLGRYQRLVGRLAASEGRRDEADAAFQDSLNLLTGIEAYLEAARTCLAWAELLRPDAPADSVGHFQQLLQDALSVFESSGLPREQERAAALLAQGA